MGFLDVSDFNKADCHMARHGANGVTEGRLKHNHFAILCAVALNQLLGFLWYSDIMFLRGWLAALGKDMSHLSRDNPLPFVAAVIASVAFCYVLSWVFEIAVVDDWQRGLIVGLLFGVGMLAPTLSMHYFFMGFDWSLVLIDSLKEIIGAGLTGAILATFRAEKLEEPAN